MRASNLITLTDAQFKQTVESSAFVLVYCWADWCKPCQAFAPVFDAMATQHPQYLFARLNIEHNPKVRAFFNIERVPALIVIRDQVVIDTVVGAMSEAELAKQLTQWADYEMQAINAHFDAKQA